MSPQRQKRAANAGAGRTEPQPSDVTEDLQPTADESAAVKGGTIGSATGGAGAGRTSYQSGGHG